MNKRVELITQSEYARRRGVAKSAVAKAVAEGRISLIDGKIDQSVADIQWAQNSRARADSGRAAASKAPAEGQGASAALDAPAAPSAATPSQELGYQDFRTRREKADAERAERENERDAGRLVDRAQVERATYDTFRALRDAVMAAPQRAAPKCVGMSDARDIEHVMADQLRKAFEAAEVRLLERLPALEKN